MRPEVQGNPALRILRKLSRVSMLGPYLRAVVWVQGCPFRCPGCITPEGLPFDGGTTASAVELADWICGERLKNGIEGVTFSGGEPMAQAEELCAVIDAVRRRSDIGVMCYTGYKLGVLQAKGTDPQKKLLSRIDLLIDGKYVREKHADLLWRGSSNQRLVFLTCRYRGEVSRIIAESGDSAAGLEIRGAGQREVAIVGVPGMARFGERLRQRLNRTDRLND